AAYPSGPASQDVQLVAGSTRLVQFSTSGPPQVQVQVTGPAEPACAYGSCSTGATIYDNDVVDGVTVTATPVDGTQGSVQTCQLGQGYPGDATSGQPASCLLNVAVGTYAVSLPVSFATPGSEVGIATAYVSGTSSQTVTVSAGSVGQANFSTVYQPSIQIQVQGPAEPVCTGATSTGSTSTGGCPGAQAASGNGPTSNDPIYDDDVVSGESVTVTPVGGGESQTCQLSGGVGGTVATGVPASCTVAVVPGQYTVSLPKSWAPAIDYGRGDVGVVGAPSQTVDVAPGDQPTVSFTTAYLPPLVAGVGAAPATTVDGPLVVVGAGAGGLGRVDVATYSNDPAGQFPSKSAVYFRVDESDGATFTKLTVTACGMSGYAEKAYWWDSGPTAPVGAWEPVASAASPAATRPGAARSAPAARQVPAPAARSLRPGCLSFYLGASTAPTLGDFRPGAGVIFAVPVGLAPQTIKFVSVPPASLQVGERYTARAVASSGSVIEYSATGAPGVCSVSAQGLVTASRPGKCVVLASQAGDGTWAYSDAQQTVQVPEARAARNYSYTTKYQTMLRVGAGSGLLSRQASKGERVFLSTRPMHGHVVLRPNGSFIYVPVRGFSGTDHFQYSILGVPARSVGSVTVKVEAPSVQLRGRHSRKHRR
ncbi:MAG TPA: Ig-like domain-containing protein, partial [Acidimicrobiales bacterium]|nr:Ig-like domain-containing protein [Acidimicrobiales bacterium]